MSANDTCPIGTPPCLNNIETNQTVFIESLNCLKETFGYSEGMLNQQLYNAKEQYKKSVGYDYADTGKFNCSEKEYNRCKNKIKRAERANELIYPSFIISLVSVFDTYLAGLVRIIFDLNEGLYMESNMKFLYRDLKDLDSVGEVKKNIVDSTIDKLFRGSHVDQIKWFEKALGVGLTSFNDWANYVELTERRNLFVHSDGVVSTQYIKMCNSHEYNLSGIEIGTKLSVDKSYFEKSYQLLYYMGVYLTQTLLNTLYSKKFNDVNSRRDKILIPCVFDLIYEKQYLIAIQVSNSVLTKHFKHAKKEELYIKLNLAQAYKWNNQKSECDNILNSIDTSALSKSLLIPIKVLKDEYKKVYDLMIEVGSNDDVLSKEAYKTWPIFREIREQQNFKDTFYKVFSESITDKDDSLKPSADEQSYDNRTISS